MSDGRLNIEDTRTERELADRHRLSNDLTWEALDANQSAKILRDWERGVAGGQYPECRNPEDENDPAWVEFRDSAMEYLDAIPE